MRETMATSNETNLCGASTFVSPSHTNTLLVGLNGLRNKGFLLDVTLKAGGQPFEAHRVVLASCSEYFRAMFTDAMKESQQKEICLNGVTAEGMSCLINYAYTSKLALNLSNCQDILSAANHLQFLDVVEACSAYLQEQMSLDNCVDIATIAETFSLHSLKKKVYCFMCANLLAFSRTAEFQRLTVFQLELCLSINFPVDCSESQVLSVVLKWIQFHYSERVHYAPHLIKSINFKEITSDELSHHYAAVKTILSDCKNNQQCANYASLQRRITYMNFSAQKEPKRQTLLNKRGMERAIVKVGGFNSISGVTNEITYYLPKEAKWKYITSVPHVDQCNFGLAVYENQLFVIGGCFNQSLQENVHPFGFKYDPLTHTWRTISPMLQERCRFSLVVIDKYLYALGGSGETDVPEIDARCEVSLFLSLVCTNLIGIDFSQMYDPVNDIWTAISPIPGGSRAQHGASTWRNFVFVSGGLDQDVVLNSMVRYNSLTDEWEGKCPMLMPRADHTMVCYGNKLFVCGGWYENEATGLRVLADTIDVYDIAQDSWSSLTRIPTPRYHAGITICGSWLYIIGGFHSDNTFDRASGAIECYDIESNSWSSFGHYPQAIWEHACSQLYIPTCREDLEVISDKITS